MSFKHELNIGPKIGDGHFGDVHEGTDDIHGKVAVKILRPFPSESPSDWNSRKESLLSEARKLKEAEHENVVQVHSLVRAEKDDRLHMVVEYCTHGSLQAEYEKGPISLLRAKTILTDVCRGLECIHTRGMVHRDIKPANILGSGKRFKIGDFGLVSNDLVSGYASLAGYLDHLAPEVHRDNITSGQSDVWALGMTIYRLLHGHAFYQEEFLAIDIPASIKNGGFAANIPWLPHIPKVWRKFIRKAMHDDTEKRFQTAFAMSQGAAHLPTEPTWNCRYRPEKTTWTRKKNDRQINVAWETLSPRKHIWSATSVGGSRTRLLDGTKTPVSLAKARIGLENFFSGSN